MLTGKWLQPRHPNRTVFEKDYPQIDLNALLVYCPGCRKEIRLSRKSSAGRIGGWCAACDRGIAP